MIKIIITYKSDISVTFNFKDPKKATDYMLKHLANKRVVAIEWRRQ